jgi:hypothetical protein
VLDVGDDNLPPIAEEEGVDPDWIKIPSHMRLPAEDCNLRGLIRTIYPHHRCHSGDAMYLMQHNILAPKNTDIDEVNNAILESLFEESHTYLSANSLTPTEEGASVAAASTNLHDLPCCSGTNDFCYPPYNLCKLISSIN